MIYDDERFELGSTLEESFRRVYIAHKNCYDYCMKGERSVLSDPHDLAKGFGLDNRTRHWFAFETAR